LKTTENCKKDRRKKVLFRKKERFWECWEKRKALLKAKLKIRTKVKKN
jgi:hypothetical protein